uniref:Transposase n=1 Tax=Candidatus Kentrum sp. LPFa TaxID=2126335 RepID=A0A450XBS2_9GAMM|nr:MAG: hypothetical protein BECKLPF1236A_GA0070988_1004114 [Candidatus Kentron sp. LPFa]VFK26743.1 MAG: hypothetical protein BECKLPF1236C_GA0070990_1003816 [Candidatus Kentron sp. LPFa]
MGVIEAARWEREEAKQEGIEEGRKEERHRYEKERATLVKFLHGNGVAIDGIVASTGPPEEVAYRLLEEG